MADLKISQLPAATTPIAGTEVLPIVQSSATKKIASDDLTVKNIRSNATSGVLQIAGPAAADTRTMTVPDANFTAARTDAAQSFTGNQTLSTGNLVVGTAGKGIDFSANANAAGMTSEIFSWYEEGTWTPTMTSASGTTTLNSSSGIYTRIGRVVNVLFTVNYSTNASVSTSAFTFGGLPFTSNATFVGRAFVSSSNQTGADYNDGSILIQTSVTTLLWTARAVDQSSRTNAILFFTGSYTV